MKNFQPVESQLRKVCKVIIQHNISNSALLTGKVSVLSKKIKTYKIYFERNLKEKKVAKKLNYIFVNNFYEYNYFLIVSIHEKLIKKINY